MTTTSPVTVLPTSTATPLEPALTLRQVFDAVAQCFTTREQEITTRAQIGAWESVTLAEIAAKEQIILTYLNHIFDERKRTFAELFPLLDKAMASGSEDVAHVLGAITTLAAKSPFNDLHDIGLVKNALNDPDHEWPV